MVKKKALIFGISGQDGSFLSELLLEKDYEVHGLIRRKSHVESQTTRIDHIIDQINTEYGDMTDYASIERFVRKVQPDEIYNLAAMSHVRISFDIPLYTVQVNAMGVANLLEIVRTACPSAKVLQASSSEIFGNCIDEDGFQRETTNKMPTSPYGCAKLFAYSLVRNYREAYGLFASNSICFNHESSRRGSNFVTQKVVKTAVQIKRGLCDKLVLGNMDSYRDWGYSKDYVKAIWMIMQHDVPDDFVIATGETHSVRDLCKYVFSKLDMDYRDYVEQDLKFMRPEELNRLRGDCSKAKSILGWEPEYTFEEILDEMIENWESIFDGKKMSEIENMVIE